MDVPLNLKRFSLLPVMCSIALDSPESALTAKDPVSQLLSRGDTSVNSKNFFVHYEFPNYATNEIKPIIGGQNR